jgi:hypothetical protein
MHQDTHAAAPLLPPARLVGEPEERRDQIHWSIVAMLRRRGQPARSAWPGRVAALGDAQDPRRSRLLLPRRRGEELAAWTHSLAWRAPLVAAAGAVVQLLAAQAGLPQAGLAGLAVAALIGWRLRFRPSEQARTWQRGAHGEHHTARFLDRLTRDGYVVFHDLAVPASPANTDHLVIGPSGVFVIDSKQWTGSVHPGRRRAGVAQPLPAGPHPGDDPLGSRHHQPHPWHPCDRAAVRARHPRPGGGLHAQGVAIVPAHLLRGALGDDRVLSDADVELLAATAWTSLRPAA